MLIKIASVTTKRISMESMSTKEVNSREKLNRKTKSKRRKKGEESEEVGQTQST